MSESGTTEEHKEAVGAGGGGGTSGESGRAVTQQSDKSLTHLSSPSSTPAVHPAPFTPVPQSSQPPVSTATSSTSASDAAKVRQLQSMMAQAREGYQSLNQRYSTLQSECRQLMKKEEDSAATIQRLTAQIHRLSAAAAVAVNTAGGMTSAGGHETDEEKSELDIDKGRRGSEVDIAAQLREQAMVDKMQQLQFDLTNQRKETEEWKQKCKDAQQQATLLKQQQQTPQRAEEEIDALRHQLQQLTLDSAAIDSLALDLSVSQKERDKAERERNVLKDEVQRLIGKLEEERDEREREQAVQQHKHLTLEQKAEGSDALAAQNAHLSEELSLLTASITQLRDQLVSTQRDNRTLREEADRVRTERAEADNKLRRYAADMEGGQLVDRRLVVKMLTTYYERGQASDVLDIMFKLLQFTDDEKRRVLDSRRSRGWVGSVASILNPFDSERDSGGVQQREDASVADLWVEFLLKETGKAEEAAPAATKPSKAIYEAIASPTAADGSVRPAAARFSTPQPQRSSTATTAPQPSSIRSSPPSTYLVHSLDTVSAPPPLPSLPSQPSHVYIQTAATVSQPAASLQSTTFRPLSPLRAVPISLPPHIRPAFPQPGRPLAAPPPTAVPPLSFASSPLPSHPVFSAGLPLPRAAVPGQPVPVVRPASPVPPTNQ